MQMLFDWVGNELFDWVGKENKERKINANDVHNIF